jgi:hypothetical protein
MLTSANIVALRKLWASPSRFVRAAISAARRYNYLGYHIDFEPESGVVDGMRLFEWS